MTSSISGASSGFNPYSLYPASRSGAGPESGHPQTQIKTEQANPAQTVKLPGSGSGPGPDAVRGQPSNQDNRPPLPGAKSNNESTEQNASVNQDKKTDTDKPGATRDATGKALGDAETREVEQLKQRDREVRAHEAAHLAAAGQYARGGASFTYQTGPDSHRYAVGGEVQIDTSAVPGDPQATIQKAMQIRAAAMAPAEPSGQDRAVAAQAAQMAAQARMELMKQNQADKSPESSSASGINANKEPEENTSNQSHSLSAKKAAQQYQGHENPAERPAKNLLGIV